MKFTVAFNRYHDLNPTVEEVEADSPYDAAMKFVKNRVRVNYPEEACQDVHVETVDEDGEEEKLVVEISWSPNYHCYKDTKEK